MRRGSHKPYPDNYLHRAHQRNCCRTPPLPRGIPVSQLLPRPGRRVAPWVLPACPSRGLLPPPGRQPPPRGPAAPPALTRTQSVRPRDGSLASCTAQSWEGSALPSSPGPQHHRKPRPGPPTGSSGSVLLLIHIATVLQLVFQVVSLTLQLPHLLLPGLAARFFFPSPSTFFPPFPKFQALGFASLSQLPFSVRPHPHARSKILFLSLGLCSPSLASSGRGQPLSPMGE